MSVTLQGNRNYAAQVVRIPRLVTLKGLDNLKGVPVLGGQALVSNDEYQSGDLAVAFGPETQLSDDFCHFNNLYRTQEKNADPGKKGYLEDNRRIRAIRLQKHESNVLLMPLSSFRSIADINAFAEGELFDHVLGVEICCKYVVPEKGGTPRTVSKVDKAFKRVQDEVFPKHLETDQLARNIHAVPVGKTIIITQKVHGTSIRVGNVPVLRAKGRVERFLNRWFPTASHEYAMVYGSKNSVKDANNPRQAHFYDEDIWTIYGRQLDGILPEGYIVYGELVGYTPSGGAIQPKYTYDAARGQAELYVYRVAYVNAQGSLADLSWDGVVEFCDARGLKHVPELDRIERYEHDPDRYIYHRGRGEAWALEIEDTGIEDLRDWVDSFMNVRLADEYEQWDVWDAKVERLGRDKALELEDVWCPSDEDVKYRERPVPLSDPKTVDEGVCLRVDGIVPEIWKAKASAFLELETKQLDKDVVTMEDEA
jgi:hypothetical protein